MVNVPLLRKTLEHIETIPAIDEHEAYLIETGEKEELAPELQNAKEFWYQGDWLIEEGSCGTAACFAGHAVLINGEHVQKEGGMYLVREEDGSLNMLDVKARQILGLDEWQAEQLFDANNTIEDIRDMVEDLIENG